MAIATITTKGQITLPKSVRERLGVDAGDRVEFVEASKGVYTVRAVSRDVRELQGMIAKPGRPVSLKAMKRAVARRASRR